MKPWLRPFWWLNPFWLLAATVVPISLCALEISDADYVHYWKAMKHVDLPHVLMIFAALGAFGLGCAAALLVRQHSGHPARTAVLGGRLPDLPWHLIRRVFQIGWALTVCGYLIWAVVSMLHGITLGTLLLMLRGETNVVYEIQNLSETIPGVTTATQFGMGVSLLGILIGCRFGWRRVYAAFAILAVLTIVRAVFRSERLAFIEILLPCLILLLRIKIHDIPPRWRPLLAASPMVAIAALYLLFTGTEYFRSWTSFYSDQADSIWWFGYMRLLGYYVTALNNGILFFENPAQLVLPGYHTMEWFWKFPLLSLVSPGYREIGENMAESNAMILMQDANPEFTNYSGIYPVFMDFGMAGGLLVWVILGFVGMCLFRAYLQGRFAGLLLYPFYFVGLTEVMRIFYFGASRSFPTWVFLIGLILLVPKAMRHSRAAIAPRARDAHLTTAG